MWSNTDKKQTNPNILNYWLWTSDPTSDPNLNMMPTPRFGVKIRYGKWSRITEMKRVTCTMSSFSSAWVCTAKHCYLTTYVSPPPAPGSEPGSIPCALLDDLELFPGSFWGVKVYAALLGEAANTVEWQCHSGWLSTVCAMVKGLVHVTVTSAWLQRPEGNPSKSPHINEMIARVTC